MLRMAGKHLKQ